MSQNSAPDRRDDEPLRDGTSLMAYLHVLRKAHIALVGRERAHARFRQLATRGHAKQYIEELMPLLLAERAKHRHRRGHHGRP
ncbi:hypothetical protein B0G57_10332 [Trinickia symbiotica]|uniref:Uncharacterized protein n=1 Tax=Trinickia symbiotica TaxID=863227 RepID=A0A2N7X4V7_9BURK|nr:hypothetical protein [Trinickia symbiotica]PMS36592.1 hypothetical protein C0Z20_10775 [Trinickia symbiotica]PPK46008.1 hypothetical protein B0G57_10332 [Trinickia symbiotica]